MRLPFAFSVNRLLKRQLTCECLIFFAFLALTILMTWPWAWHLRDAVSDPGDPYLVSWIMWWDYHQTFHDPLNLFNANIFYPYRYTLAFSEHCYGLSLPFFPLYALGFRPLTIHGIATLLGFTFSGYGAFRLARSLTNSNSAAWVAGIVFAFIPYRFSHLSHANYLFAGWIPILLEALILFARERSWRRALWLGTAFLMNGLTCIHWFVLTLIPLLVSAFVLITRQRLWRDAAFWRRGIIALSAAALLLLPFLIPYLRVSALYGFERKIDELLAFSALPGDWLVATSWNKLWGEMSARYRKGERELFPGVLPVLLALAAFIFVKAEARRNASNLTENATSQNANWRNNSTRRAVSFFGAHSILPRLVLFSLNVIIAASATVALLTVRQGSFKFQLFGFRLLRSSNAERAFVWCLASLSLRLCVGYFLALRAGQKTKLVAIFSGDDSETFILGGVWTCLGFFGSFGLNFFFHRALYDYIPLFHSIRVPARWAMICYLGLALLAGLGARQIVRLLTLPRPRMKRYALIVYAVIVLAVLFEQRTAPLNLFRGAVDPDLVTLRLRQTQMRGGIVELPVGVENSNYVYVLRAADHARPLVTAVSGFMPPIEAQIESLTQRQPVPESFLRLLEEIPASYLIVHNGNLIPENRVALETLLAQGTTAGRLRFIRSYNRDPFRDDLYAVTKTEPQAQSEAPLPRFMLSPATDVFLTKDTTERNVAEPSANAIDDAEFFVRQHYKDFLEREPDSGGLNYWAMQIRICGADRRCLEEHRITVSEAFLVEPEFQETALFVYRLYKGTLNRQPTFEDFVRDRRAVVGGAGLDARKTSLVEAWVKRAEFTKRYPPKQTPEEFVEALLKTAQQASGVDQSAQREKLIEQLRNASGSGTSVGNSVRAAIVRQVIEDKQFAAAEFNGGFVATAYFAYLRREPNAGGAAFWNEMLSDKMHNNYRNMVREFIGSKEYRARFTKP